ALCFWAEEQWLSWKLVLRFHSFGCMVQVTREVTRGHVRKDLRNVAETAR
ncbi:hypothetical protein AK812_SmicGene47317, partial [Symbiodinium microadriaticum]